METPQKLKIEPPLDPPIPPLGIHLKETKSVSQKDNCTPMLSAASLEPSDHQQMNE